MQLIELNYNAISKGLVRNDKPFLFLFAMKDQKIRIAIQKGGRLHDNSLELLRGCGIKVDNYSNKLRTEASNFPLEVLFLRDDDIAQCVQDGVADLGIVGENLLEETEASVLVKKKLGFGKCKLSIALPREKNYNSIQDLSGIRIATTYGNILAKFLKAQGVAADIHSISGSVEIAPSIGLADAVFDIVSTGSTLTMNGLKEVEVVMRSEAVLIANKDLEPQAAQLLEKILFRIDAVQRAKAFKYILLNTPNEKIETIADILPGMNSPTIVPLTRPGWSSLHSVVNEEDFWEVIESLKAHGAEGILVAPIEKMFI